MKMHHGKLKPTATHFSHALFPNEMNTHFTTGNLNAKTNANITMLSPIVKHCIKEKKQKDSNMWNK